MSDALSVLNEQENELRGLIEDLLQRAKKGGADHAEISAGLSRGLSVTVRKRDVETLELSNDRSLSLTVYRGQRRASAHSADLSRASLEDILEQALVASRYAEADPAIGLADPELMATDLAELDIFDATTLDAEQAIAIAQRTEAAGLEASDRIRECDAATMESDSGLSLYANTHGFVGSRRASRHSLSAIMIAAHNGTMQRDYAYDTKRYLADLQQPERIGEEAAQRTVARLGARQSATENVPVLFSAEMARGLLRHLVAGLGGAAQYRKASFLLDSVGTKIFPDWFSLVERPRLQRSLGAANFDAEGVATRENLLIDRGVIQRLVLNAYAARRLGLQTTANAGGVRNLTVEAPTVAESELIRSIDRGLLVTELLGQGVNIVTGDYSRGAAGFWIEKGEIAFPVEEVTIAGTLPQMFGSLEAVGAPIDERGNIRTGPLLIGSMTVAGK